jgi:hypothetical protein
MVKWTDKYIRILKRDYPMKGSSIPLLRRRFSHEAIRGQAKNLHIKVNKTWRQKHFKNTLDKYRVIRWGHREIAILKREYPKKGTKIKQLSKKFTRGAIKRKADVLNIQRKGLFWTKEEIKKLRQNWKSNIKLSNLFPQKSLLAIYKKAKRLGLKSYRDKATKLVKKLRKKK